MIEIKRCVQLLEGTEIEKMEDKETQDNQEWKKLWKVVKIGTMCKIAELILDRNKHTMFIDNIKAGI